MDQIDRVYVVQAGRGRLKILVRWKKIANLGERNAVAETAWMKLLGQNELGEIVEKRSPTRAALVTELLSTYEPYRYQVYDKFKSSIKFTMVGVSRDGTI